MKILKSTLTVALASFGVVVAHAQAEELRLGDFQSTTHIVSVEGTTKWMQEVEEATDGEVTFSHFPSEQAAPADGLLDAVSDGVLDAALIGPIYTTETLPLNSMVGLPGYYSSAEEGTRALQEMISEGPLREELLEADVMPVFAFVLPPYQILANERLGTPEDWDGLDIRTSGSTQAMTARALGAVGVSMPGPEIYTAVERGRLDGVLFPLPSVAGYNLNEVVSHISTNGAFGGYSFVMVVRRDLFEGLSSDEQQAMLDAGDKVALHVAKAQDDSVDELTQEWADQGVEIYQFTEEELQAINETVSEEPREQWLERIGGSNPEAAEAVLNQYEELISAN